MTKKYIYTYGSSNYMAKLTENKVITLRQYWDSFMRSQPLKSEQVKTLQELSKKYHVNRNTIKDIVENKSWKHVRLCEMPYRANPPGVHYTPEQREFTRKCFIDAGIKLAKEKKIWNVKTKELEHQAGGLLKNYWTNLDTFLAEIEPYVYPETNSKADNATYRDSDTNPDNL